MSRETAALELAVLCGSGIGLWIGLAYLVGRVWTYRHNKQRRAAYRRRNRR